MREIRFRAWDRKNKWMDDEIFVGPHGIYERASLTYDTPNLEIERSDEYELMQFTGLRDKNGVDIYEGDVCNFNLSEDEHGSERANLCGAVSIGPYGPVFGAWIGVYCNGFEVIGNIYENPELLK